MRAQPVVVSMGHSTVPHPGLLIGGLVLALTGIWMLSMSVHWFPAMLLVLGIVALPLAFMRPNADAPTPAASEPRSALATQLRELESLRDAGVVNQTEYAAKRAQLIDAWGRT